MNEYRPFPFHEDKIDELIAKYMETHDDDSDSFIKFGILQIEDICGQIDPKIKLELLNFIFFIYELSNRQLHFRIQAALYERT